MTVSIALLLVVLHNYDTYKCVCWGGGGCFLVIRHILGLRFTGLFQELEALLGHKGYGQVGPWRVVPVRMDLYRDDGECHQVRRRLALRKTPC